MSPILLVFLAAACRLLPHAPNFTPIGAMALYAGSEIKDVKLALLMTLSAMLLSDLVIGSDITSVAVYFSLAITVILGRYFRSTKNVGVGVLSASVSATLFFLITNFAVWLASGIYPLTSEGLAACFTAAIPFFGNTMSSEYLYFGGLCVLGALIRSSRGSRGLSFSS